MESFLKGVMEGRGDKESKRYFVRFGKGKYARRFLLKLDKGKRIKIKTSFEMANDLVKFANELKSLKFSGKILTKEKIPGLEGRKKAGVFVYEIAEAGIGEFGNAYYYLLDINDSEVVLKIKKSLPKPGKDEEKIDENFCALEMDLKFWPQAKETFFWDLPADCKKALIEHELLIDSIEFPKEEKDPVKIRELAIRKGKITRKINCDGKEIKREFELAV